MPELSLIARLRRRPERGCAECGLPFGDGLTVRDIDANGDLADYHQGCAPSLTQPLAAQRLARDRSPGAPS